MRIFENCYDLVSEIYRDVWEMGKTVMPKSMQNKTLEESGDVSSFLTKEIINYHYCLQSRDKDDYLFKFDPRSRDWCDAEFRERIDMEHHNPGEAYKLRKDLWETLTQKASDMFNRFSFDYTYNERIREYMGIDHIVQAIKKDPDSRQLILAIWDRSDISHIGGKRRVPCSIYYQFLVRDGKVNIIYNMRSCDVVTHFGNDVYLAFEMMKYIAGRTGLQEGYLYHNIASLHCYEKDWFTLKSGISNLRNNG